MQPNSKLFPEWPFLTVLEAAWGEADLARYANPCDYGSVDREMSSAAQAAVTGTQYGGPRARFPMHFSQYYTIKLLPWQLDLQPHKRNTSNSFLRMPQIAHAQGISLKNTFPMLFLMSDEFRILNQSWWTGKWEELSTYTGELHAYSWFVPSVMGTCVYAYLHMCGCICVQVGTCMYRWRLKVQLVPGSLVCVSQVWGSRQL